MADIIKQERKVFDLINMETTEKALIYAKWAVEKWVAPPKLTVPEYFMLLQAGNDLGMNIAMIHNSLAFINGRVTMWGKEVLARAKRAGYKISYPEKTDTKVTVMISKDSDSHTESYTIDQARKAGLMTRDVWMKYTQEMLTHKAVARAIDNFCPEVLGGFSIKEDMDEPITRTPTEAPDLSMMIEAPKVEEIPVHKFPRNMHMIWEIEEEAPPEDMPEPEPEPYYNPKKKKSL